MDNLELLRLIEDKLIKMNEETEKTLYNLNNSVPEKYNGVEGRNDLDLAYYRDVAIYAWGERGKRDTIGDLYCFIRELKKQIQ